MPYGFVEVRLDRPVACFERTDLVETSHTPTACCKNSDALDVKARCIVEEIEGVVTGCEAADRNGAVEADLTARSRMVDVGEAFEAPCGGDHCVYEGAETLEDFDIVEVTHRNDSSDVSIVGVGSLGESGPINEDIAAESAKDAKVTDEPPLGFFPRLSVSQAPLLLAVGEDATMVVSFTAAREHIVICFGGDLSGPRNVVPAGSCLVSR